MARTATATTYTYLDCPTCGSGIAKPFALRNGPDVFVHAHGRTRCRLIVSPRDRCAVPMVDQETFEAAIARWSILGASTVLMAA